MTSFGLTLNTLASSRPHREYEPGLELSIQMSARAIILRNSSLPFGLEKSSVTPKTLRRSWMKFVETGSPPSLASNRMPMVRHPASPLPGRSTWMTSAPISAASSAANGCAMSVPVDTIFTPCKGPKASGTSVFSGIPSASCLKLEKQNHAPFPAKWATEARRRSLGMALADFRERVIMGGIFHA
jgi:hypothetical protein